jgi:hypothetical protein
VTQIDLKEQVQRAIAVEWPAFAQAHPRLAAAIDQNLLIEQAADQLADDPDYQQAMRQAELTGAAAHAGQEIVTRFVRGLVRSFL